MSNNVPAKVSLVAGMATGARVVPDEEEANYVKLDAVKLRRITGLDTAAGDKYLFVAQQGGGLVCFEYPVTWAPTQRSRAFRVGIGSDGGPDNEDTHVFNDVVVFHQETCMALADATAGKVLVCSLDAQLTPACSLDVLAFVDVRGKPNQIAVWPPYGWADVQRAYVTVAFQDASRIVEIELRGQLQAKNVGDAFASKHVIWGVAVCLREGSPTLVISATGSSHIFLRPLDPHLGTTVLGGLGNDCLGNDDGAITAATFNQPAGLATSPWARSSVFIASIGGQARGTVRLANFCMEGAKTFLGCLRGISEAASLEDEKKYVAKHFLEMGYNSVDDYDKHITRSRYRHTLEKLRTSTQPLLREIDKMSVALSRSGAAISTGGPQGTPKSTTVKAIGEHATLLLDKFKELVGMGYDADKLDYMSLGFECSTASRGHDDVREILADEATNRHRREW